jgi:hypothetical protein
MILSFLFFLPFALITRTDITVWIVLALIAIGVGWRTASRDKRVEPDSVFELDSLLARMP